MSMQKLILLIDDDQDEYFILNQAIQLSGLTYYCIWANSPARAKTLLQEMQPDLILIDYNMPGTNGIECLDMIRHMYGMEHVPTVMYSSHISKITQELALTKGATCFQKPGDIWQLVRYLSKVIIEGNMVPTVR